MPTTLRPDTESDRSQQFTDLLSSHIATARFRDFVSFFQGPANPLLPDIDKAHSFPPHTLSVTQLGHRLSDLPHSQPGYIGLRRPVRPVPPLEVLLEDGYRLIEYADSTRLFTDVDGVVHMVLVPCPGALENNGLNDALLHAMNDAKTSINFSASNATEGGDGSRIGRAYFSFPTISTGISHGGGQTEPRRLNHTSENAATLDSLASTNAIAALATWQSGADLQCYRRWMPRVHKATDDVLSRILNWRSGLRRNFASSSFGSVTYNFGPKAVCDFHVDALNWAPGGCAITPAGTYDYRRGGHLVIEELKLVVEFPPCTTFIIQSALLTHGNTDVAPEEERISITQYTAGGLFRWVESGFDNASVIRAGMSQAALSAEGRSRWIDSIGLYSNLADFNLRVPDCR